MPVVDYLGILRAVLIQIQRWLLTLTCAKQISGISPFSIPRARQLVIQTSSDTPPGSYEIKRYKERPRASYKQLVMQMVNVATNISILGYRFSSFLFGSINLRWLSAINGVTWCANDFDGYFEKKKWSRIKRNVNSCSFCHRSFVRILWSRPPIIIPQFLSQFALMSWNH